jgi:hypothetical protein
MKDWLNRITACLYVIGAVSLALAAEQDKQALEARARAILGSGSEAGLGYGV